MPDESTTGRDPVDEFEQRATDHIERAARGRAADFHYEAGRITGSRADTTHIAVVTLTRGEEFWVLKTGEGITSHDYGAYTDLDAVLEHHLALLADTSVDADPHTVVDPDVDPVVDVQDGENDDA